MRSLHQALPLFTVLLSATFGAAGADAQPITAAGQPAQLDVRAAGERSLRITLKPVSFKDDVPRQSRGRGSRSYPAPALSLREITRPVRKKVGALSVEVRPNPLTLRVTNDAGALVQEIVFESDGTLSFKLDDHPVLGLGEGGPLPEKGTAVARASGAVRSPRTARHDAAALAGRHVRLAQPGRDAARHAAAGACSSRRRGDRSISARPTAASSSPGSPATPSACRRTSATSSRRWPRACRRPDAVVPGLYDLFVFDAADPATAMKDFSVHHRARGDAAAVGARLHAVAPDARGRRADARHRRHVPSQADPARRA